MSYTPHNETLPQIVFVTDRGFLKPTLVAMWGVLRHLSVPGIVHFWGNGLDEQDWGSVQRVAETNTNVSLNCLAMSDIDFEAAKGPTEHITATTMGRLFIPSRLSGRVLYIDGDTQIVGDVAPLFSMDLKGSPIGAVRDYLVTKWSIDSLSSRDDVPSRIRQIQQLLSNNEVSQYFNAGILLIDTDAIRADAELLNAMQDVALASSYPMGDQDHLNLVFLNRVHLLNPSYNSTWDRAKKQRQQIAQLGGSAEETKSLRNTILHFHGAQKPWKVARYDLWKRRARAVWNYRREMREFGRIYPDLMP